MCLLYTQKYSKTFAKALVIECCTQILHFFHKTNFVGFSIQSASAKHSCDSSFVNVSLFSIVHAL